MKLISSTREYKAINLIKRDSRYSIYRCSCKGRSYLLYLVCDENLEKSLVACFGKMTGFDFDGFVELFADGDRLVLVFKDNILEETTADHLGDETDERSNLMFFERVLEALCVHEVPANIACDLLENDNIGVKSDGSADCRYILHNFSAFDNCGMERLAEKFTQKLRRSLAPFGRNKRTPLIEKFCKELKVDTPETMTELYDRYIRCVEECSEVELGETKAQRLKKKAMKAASVGKVILTVLVLGLAFLMLVVSIVDDGSGSGEKIEQIGDVIIEENISD